MDLAIYAHPWDLRALAAHGGLPRLRDLGYREVALAVSYHAGRWLTPWHPDGLVRFLEDGTVHYRPRGDYGRLQPLASREVRAGEPSPLEWLCAHAPAAGLRARAWAVLTHNTRLGDLHPDCCVQNALGDRYTYSLCPGNADVQRYLAAMVGDLAAHAGLHAIELEAVAPIGHRHNSHHDKNSFGVDAYTDALLSTCFCAACRHALADLQHDGVALGADGVERLRTAFAAALRRHFADGDCMAAPAPKLDQEQLLGRLRAEFGPSAMTLLGARVLAIVRTLATAGVARQRGVRLCVQGNHDALRQAASLPFAVLGGFVDEAAMTVYGEKAAEVGAAVPHLLGARGEALRPQLSPLQQPSLRLGLHPRAPQYGSDDDLRRVRDLCAQHGIAAISIYHLGLLPWRTIERAAKVLTA